MCSDVLDSSLHQIAQEEFLIANLLFKSYSDSYPELFRVGTGTGFFLLNNFRTRGGYKNSYWECHGNEQK